MKKYIVAISLSIIALGLCSCRRDDTTPAEVKEELRQREVVFTASGKGYTVKSTESGFGDGDVIGIFAPEMEKYNVKGSVQGGNKLVPETPIYWEKEQSRNSVFYACYPYNEEITSSTFTFSVASDQTTDEAFLASDLRTAHVSAAPLSTVAFVLGHSFSKITFNFTGLSGGESVTGVVIKDMLTQATVDIGTGGLGSEAEKADISAHKASSASFEAVIIPQSFLKTEVSTSTGRTLKYTTYTPFAMDGGCAYKATLTIPAPGHDTSETGFTFAVVDWDNGEVISYGEPTNKDSL